MKKRQENTFRRNMIITGEVARTLNYDLAIPVI